MIAWALAWTLAAAQEPAGAELARRLEAAEDPRELARLAAELHALHDAAPSEARDGIKTETLRALRAARDRRFSAWEARFAAAEAVGRLKDARVELQRRRDAALRAVADAKTYVPERHPDFGKGDAANGQALVDTLVLAKHPGSVGALWAEGPKADVDPALRAEARDYLDASAKAHALFAERDPKGPDVLLHHLSLQTLDLRSFALDPRDAELFAWNRKVDRYNETLADADVGAPEKEHAAVINEYREMMGRRRLFLDVRLCRSSRKHSAACDAAQKIWHSGPDGDPQTRARLESFPNPVAENVAIAFAHPADVWWRGWFRASDHHRNAISDAWTCMGYGFVGNVGTQTFSTLPPPKALR